MQPWIAKDDDQGQKMWRINQRIVKLIVELMRNHERPESLVILSSASDLLLRATDGMLVDGEACTLAQLEVTRHYLYLCSYSSVTYRVWVVTMFNYKTCIPPTSLSCYNNCLCSAPRKFLLV